MAKSYQRSELEAKLVAAFVSLGCLLFFVLVARQQRREISYVHVANPQPSIEQLKQPLDRNQKFREIPDIWRQINFNDHTYGSYRFSDGRRRITLTLKNGEYEYDFRDDDRGGFSLSKVYYVDVTGDQIPEAIVDLSVVECGGGSCDGGSDLFFIYSINAEGKIKELWQYQTGSYGFGCGLKSLTVEGQEVQLELFGRCPLHVTYCIGPEKAKFKDLTRLVFRYTGKNFIEDKLEFISTPLTDVKNYRAEVHINEAPG